MSKCCGLKMRMDYRGIAALSSEYACFDPSHVLDLKLALLLQDKQVVRHQVQFDAIRQGSDIANIRRLR